MLVLLQQRIKVALEATSRLYQNADTVYFTFPRGWRCVNESVKQPRSNLGKANSAAGVHERCEPIVAWKVTVGLRLAMQTNENCFGKLC
jgi:hypothetical protein